MKIFFFTFAVLIAFAVLNPVAAEVEDIRFGRDGGGGGGGSKLYNFF